MSELNRILKYTLISAGILGLALAPLNKGQAVEPSAKEMLAGPGKVIHKLEEKRASSDDSEKPIVDITSEESLSEESVEKPENVINEKAMKTNRSMKTDKKNQRLIQKKLNFQKTKKISLMTKNNSLMQKKETSKKRTGL